MTEDEAKTKWCPYAATLSQRTGFSNCHASKCMMWIWVDSPEVAARRNAISNANAVPNGHCGLAK